MHFQPGAAKPAANISSLLAISSSSFPPKITNISYFNKISCQVEVVNKLFLPIQHPVAFAGTIKISIHWCWSIRMMNYVYRYTQWQRKIPIWNRNHYKHDRNCPLFEVFSPLKCTKIPQNFRLRRAQIPKNVVSGTYEPGTYGNLELANQARGIPEHERKFLHPNCSDADHNDKSIPVWICVFEKCIFFTVVYGTQGARVDISLWDHCVAAIPAG